MARNSTNALTARYCKLKGWPCATVQAFYGGRRHDLFGIADSVILRPGRLALVQNCSYGSLKAHRDKISSDEHKEAREAILASGAILELWEWRRRKAKGQRKKSWWVRCQDLDGAGWMGLSDWEGPQPI